MDACENCGSYDHEQSGDRHNMTVRCTKCGETRTLHSFREDGEDKWRDDRDNDRRY
jgi:translation initiation factor 2 beta subunit (eIF-2beta)/eIF-5